MHFILRISQYCIGIILTSLYFFPFEFKPMSFINTKQLMAVLGLMVLGLRLAEGKGPGNGFVQKDFFMLSVLAILVSLAGLFSVTYNNTPDYTYAGYIMSFWVWIGGAYAVYSYIKYTHERCSILHIINYLIVVCVVQGILAVVIDNNQSFKNFVDTYVEQGQAFLNADNVKRLYGIGANLDVAGSRFASILIIISFVMLGIEQTSYRKFLPYYIISFILITITGNMIARTTSVGVIMGLFFLFMLSWNKGLSISPEAKRIWMWAAVGLLIIVPIAIYFYNNNASVHHNIRFAFEGFFNYFEKGKWEIGSNEKLKTMYIYPENIKTWIIGDGYFNSPHLIDPYFVGKVGGGGYYMGTDVGYLRFIFYFGVIGLLSFMNFFWNACKICYNRFEGTKSMFLMILLVNFIIWFKVSTDIFLVFALFLCVGKEENEEYMKSIALEQEEDNQE